MTGPTCYQCDRELVTGEQVWASDWKVIDVAAGSGTVRAEVRYTCDDCSAVVA